MAVQDELFQLIKCLTPSEKRYFKTNAAKSGDAKSNYVLLFDAIESQGEEYDEKVLREKHSKKPFIKYLSAEKKYLREQIMKQMRAYHSDETIDTKIHELIQDAAFHNNKGLVALNEKSLLKAKELAVRYERYHLLKLILKKLTGFTIEFEKKKISDPVIALINEQKQLAIVQETDLELETKNRELFSIYRSGADISDQKVRNRVDMLINEVERHRMRVGNSFTLGVHFHRANSTYFQLIGDKHSSLSSTQQEYQLYQQFPHFKTEDSKSYKVCLANLMSRAHSAKDSECFLKALKEIKEQPVESFNEEGEVFQNIYFSEHLFHINKGDLEKAVALIPIIEDGLIKYEAKINLARRLSFQFNIMIMYFLMHDFKSALKWTEPLLTDNSEIKQQQKFITALLLPFIHFELGHVDLVESFARSAYRLLKGKGRLHGFEQLVIKYLQNMPLSPDRPEFRSGLQDFHQGLQRLINDPTAQSSLGLEELALWAQSRAEGVKMSGLLRAAADN